MATTDTFRFTQSMVGKKAIMAVSGTVMFGWIFVHMIGNLQIYAGPQKINDYGKFLHDTPALLWGSRIVLLFAVLAHVFSALSLYGTARSARTEGYRKSNTRAATVASKSMRYGGIVLVAFIVYHLAQLTWGVKATLPQFVFGDVYCNVVHAFKIWWITAIYLVAQVFLFLHLYHGVWSVFQTLGVNSPRWDERFQLGAKGFAALVLVGNCSIPVAVLAGIVPSAGICS
ncbi:MAG: succinate dehydrogenase cytochrome b subunit [Myxococcales bacterium]|nr:succinate dehydrogenase cytochrome b subunit [Myxococcales bacterium]